MFPCGFGGVFCDFADHLPDGIAFMGTEILPDWATKVRDTTV